MSSNSSRLLPALVGLAIAGVWFCYHQLGDSAGPNGGLGGHAAVMAAGEQGLSPPGLSPGKNDESSASSERRPVEIPLPEAVDEPATEAVASEEYETRVVGHVTRAGGAPVAKARIVLRKPKRWLAPPADAEDVPTMGAPSPAREAISDEDGRFVLYDVPPGKYSLAVRAPRMAPLMRPAVEIPEHEDYDLGRYQMEAGIQLKGRVYGAKGAALEGVLVLSAISREAGYSRLELPGVGVPVGITNTTGEFVVQGLAPGSWHLMFEAPGYRVAELKGNTEPAGQEERNLRLSMELGLSINGSVVGLDPIADGPYRVTARCTKDQPTGAAKELNGSERHRSRHGLVLEDGTFEVAGLAPGVRYRLRLYQRIELEPVPGVQEEHFSWKIVEGVEDIDEFPGPGQVEFKYHDQAQVTLRVVHGVSGAVLQGFTVQVTGSGLTGGGLLKGEDDEVRTDFPGGTVVFDGLGPKETGTVVAVRVRAEGFADFLKENTMLRPGDKIELGEVELQPAPMGRVLVLDAETGEPIPEARVAYSKMENAKRIGSSLSATGDLPQHTDRVRFVQADKQGVARLTMWKNLPCSVRAIAKGYLMGDEKTLSPPYKKMLEIKLKRAGQVTVRVADGQGLAVSGMYIQHKIDGKKQRSRNYWDPDSGLENKTGEGGEVVFLNLPMGRHTFQVLETQDRFGRGGESAGHEAEGDVFLKEGETKVLSLRVSARGGLKATILQNGEPLVGALVKIKPADAKASRNNYWFGGRQQDPRTQISDHAGRVIFNSIKVGRYSLRVSHGDRRMVVTREVFINREPLDIRIDLGLTVVEGQVLDPQGEPIVGVSVYVSPVENAGRDQDMNDYRMKISEDEDGDANWDFEPIKAWSIRTDQDGRYQLSGVKPDVLLRVTTFDNAVVGENRELGPLGPQEYVGSFDFVLKRAGSLALKLADVNRSERTKYRFELARMLDNKEVDKRTVKMRSWRSTELLHSLLPGKWRVRLHHADVQGAVDERVAEVRVGDKTEIVFRP